MSRSSALILLGVLTMLAPFSGLPSGFRTFLAVVFGAAVVIVGLAERSAQVRASREALERSAPVPESARPESPHGVSPI